ncbi:hypothetical protein [Bathymodiolus thermophilus thioautotrophic gill symbiont]|uniref:hypothetical protein n=1 Tax=Bathymodiolus thermophilus thioautotrophic gill symbiont TaxID=2360 RepID=UPI000F087B50|nr:hypothetical protein [Bathymodiolus thermophilus thioautotrophic gill symbiont]
MVNLKNFTLKDEIIGNKGLKNNPIKNNDELQKKPYNDNNRQHTKMHASLTGDNAIYQMPIGNNLVSMHATISPATTP